MPVEITRKPSSPPATLAEVIDRLKRHEDLGKTVRRDLISSVTRAASLLRRPPCEIKADVPDLRQRLLGVHPVAARISAKSLSNIKANLTRALEITGALPRSLPRVEPSVQWKDFLGHANARHQAIALARLARYCTARGIEPSALDDDVMEAFRAYLHDRLLTRDPAKLCKAMAQTWNGIVKRNGLDLVQLSIPRAGNYLSAPLSAYPASLQEDLQLYLERLSRPDLFSEHGLDKPLRPTTLRNIKAQIRQVLDGAIMAGYERDHFHTLADLVDTEVLGKAFDVIAARIGRDTPATLHNISATILAVARHHVKAPSDIIASIAIAKRRIAHRLGSGRPTMSAKNMDRLAQFEDRANVALLVSLPDKLMKRAQMNSTSSLSALDAMHAVAIAILLGCPMRIANLAGLDIEKDLTVLKKGAQRRYLIRVESVRVKNGVPIDFDLDIHVSRLLSRYLDHHRQHLSEQPGTALFPRRSGGPRDPKHLGDSVKQVIWRETGLVMNAHLFRHLAGMLFLQHHPGEFETVRRLLGHRKLETTLAFYARFDSKWAAKRYDEVVLSEFRRAS
jgi:integrase